MIKLIDLESSDAIKFGKDWMCFTRYENTDKWLRGWNLDSNGFYQMNTISVERVDEVWREYACVYRKVASGVYSYSWTK